MNALKRGFESLQRFSAFLLLGTLIALIWANFGQDTYKVFVEDRLMHPDTYAAYQAAGGLKGLWASIYEFFAYLLAHDPVSHEAIKLYEATHTEHAHSFSFHFVVNDLFMVLFFGIAAKEVSESFLPGGALSSLSKASMPAIATVGGVLGPVATFFILNAIFAPTPDIHTAWAVPTATDIAYCWLFAQIIFGRSHPAVTFLLVLAVLDDLIGMLIIAVFYTNEVHLQWLGLVVGAIVICEAMRRFGVKSFWPYLIIGGTMCWFGLHKTGVHAALALVPVIPFMPHGGRDAGLFKEKGEGDFVHDEEHDPGHADHEHGHHNDTMNAFEHFFKPIVDVGLFTFGLANAGVVLSMGSFTASPTWIILGSLLVGKTLGILVFAFIGIKLGFSLPKPMRLNQVVVLGCVAGIGFTVALFVTTVALSSAPKELADAFMASGTGDMLKLGALLSFSAGPIALVISKIIKLERLETKEDLDRAVAAFEE